MIRHGKKSLERADGLIDGLSFGSEHGFLQRRFWAFLPDCIHRARYLQIPLWPQHFRNLPLSVSYSSDIRTMMKSISDLVRANQQ